MLREGYDPQRLTTGLRALVDQLNLVTGEDVDELELRVAQLEHRLRLLEQDEPRL